MALARIRTVFSGVVGTPWYSNLYFLNDGGTSVAAQANTWVGTFWNTVDGQMYSGITWATDGEVPTFNQADGKITKVDAVTPVTGSGSTVSDPLPPTTQLLIRLNTAAFVNGRRVKGRIFVPGLGEVESTQGRPSSAVQTAALGAINTLISSSVGTLAIWSRPFDGDPTDATKPPRLGTAHPVSTASIWSQWAVLRSRRD